MVTQRCAPLFIGHGSPMNAIASNGYTAFLSAYPASRPVPTAIVVISAHWQTYGTFITGSAAPEQIYDFYGFPDELYSIRYAAPGSPETAALLESGSHGIRLDAERGIDHAAWAVLKHLYPSQDIPVLELSLDRNKSESEHLELGRSLERYCSQGILFIGSGNLVHNLRTATFDDEGPYDWAVSADNWFKEKLERPEIADLTDYKKSMPQWQKAVPTDEHFLPLLYILGMMREGDRVHTLHESMQNGSVSMRSLEIV